MRVLIRVVVYSTNVRKFDVIYVKLSGFLECKIDNVIV